MPACSAAPPTSSTGWRATSSAPRTPRACSTSPTACRCCPTTSSGAGPRLGRALGGAAASHPASPPPTTSATRSSSAENVLRFMILDAGNPSSIYCCLRAARESRARVRGAITSEMYEDLNSSWLEMREFDYARHRGATACREFFDWVKMRSHLFRGVTFGTMLRDEAYHFIRLGTHLERADNTARILDVKYHTCCRSAADVGGAVDYYQWGALLRSVSGFESYRKIYSDVITPRRVAELLILRDDMPRSLHACMNFIHETLELLCDDDEPRARARRPASCTRELHYGKTDDIIRFGLHEYLMDFLARDLGAGRRDQPRTSWCRRY